MVGSSSNSASSHKTVESFKIWFDTGAELNEFIINIIDMLLREFQESILFSRCFSGFVNLLTHFYIFDE